MYLLPRNISLLMSLLVLVFPSNSQASHSKCYIQPWPSQSYACRRMIDDDNDNDDEQSLHMPLTLVTTMPLQDAGRAMNNTGDHNLAFYLFIYCICSELHMAPEI